jgi:membrane dipeptidase
MRPARAIGSSAARFDFRLSSEQEARAKKLHRQCVVIDLLSQHAGGNIFAKYSAELQAEFRTVMAAENNPMIRFLQAVYWPYEMAKVGRSDLIREWYLASGLTCGTYGIAVHDGRDEFENRWETATARYKGLPWLRYVTTAKEIRQAKQANVVAFYGHCQPTCAIPRDLKAFDIAYAKGLRSFMLTYNLMNEIGVGCTERVDAGLSTFGLQVVRHCNELGMIIDVSHCGDLTTLDACRHSNKPVNANHTAARGVFRHARGKSDEGLRAIAGTGGVIGVVALPAFLTDAALPTIEHMLDHIDYIADLVGWQHVAIGTDWPLQAPDDVLRVILAPSNTALGFRNEDRLDVTARLLGFDDCRDLPNITRGLVSRGYTDEQIAGILGENSLRVLAEVCG